MSLSRHRGRNGSILSLQKSLRTYSMMNISRRTALCNIAMSASLVYGREKGSAFALIGDRYHNSDYIRTALGKTLGQDMGISIDFCDEVKMLDAESLRGCKLLIMLR